MDHEIQHPSAALRDQLPVAEGFRRHGLGCYRGACCLINPACPLKGGHPLWMLGRSSCQQINVMQTLCDGCKIDLLILDDFPTIGTNQRRP